MELSVKRDGNVQIYYQSSIIWRCKWTRTNIISALVQSSGIAAHWLEILKFTLVPELSNYHVRTNWTYQQGRNNMVIQVVNKVV